MYKTNKLGSKTEPCGIPLVTCVHLDESSPTLILCFLPVRKLLFPAVASLCHNLSDEICGTFSKAFIRSIY